MLSRGKLWQEDAEQHRHLVNFVRQAFPPVRNKAPPLQFQVRETSNGCFQNEALADLCRFYFWKSSWRNSLLFLFLLSASYTQRQCDSLLFSCELEFLCSKDRHLTISQTKTLPKSERVKTQQWHVLSLRKKAALLAPHICSTVSEGKQCFMYWINTFLECNSYWTGVLPKYFSVSFVKERCRCKSRIFL